MGQEDLAGMSREQLLLRDLIYEMPEVLRDASSESMEYRSGLYSLAKLMEMKLEAFEIDQTKFARQMPDVSAWYERGEL